MGSHTTRFIGRPVGLLLAVLLMVPLVSAIPTTQQAAQAAAKEFVFAGGGWGHTVGMSQYGAYGLAKNEGRTYDEILNHYYAGSDVAELGSDLRAADPLWVNLEFEATNVTLRPDASSGSRAVAVRFAGSDLELPIGQEVRVSVIGGGAGTPVCLLAIGDSEHTGKCKVDLIWDGAATTPTTRIAIESVTKRRSGVATTCRLNDWNAVPSTYRTCTYARGSMHIRPDNNTASFHVVQKMDIDDYVLGISEMAYYWSLPSGGPNGMEALKAQAVAARSYAAKRQIARGDPSGRAICWCHVYDTGVDQRYVGWGHSGLGQQGWLDAVRATRGEVLTHPSERRSGALLPLETFYGSSSYGATEPASLIFNLDKPYLVSVDDRWALDPRVKNRRGSWTKTLNGSELAGRLGLAKGRTIVNVEIRACSPSGAAASIRFIDDKGGRTTVEIRKLRGVLGLNSPQVRTINGKTPCQGGGEDASLAAGDLFLDDDRSGDSSGNGNAVAECGEVIEVDTNILNDGGRDLAGLTGALTVTGRHVSIAHNTSSTIGSVSVGASARNSNDWDLAIASDAPDGHTARLKLTVTSSADGPWHLEYPLVVSCNSSSGGGQKPLQVATITVDDGVRGDSRGNGDNEAQCAETIELYVSVENGSGNTVSRIEGTLRTNDPYLDLLYNSSSGYRDLGRNEVADNNNDWDIHIAKSVPAGHIAQLELRVTSSIGSFTLPIDLPIDCGSTSGPSNGDFTISATLVDDGVRGDSRGNSDRTAQCGETIELYVELTNRGPATTALTARFQTNDKYMTLLHNKSSTYPAMARSTSADNNNDWDIKIKKGMPAKHTAAFSLMVTGDNGSTQTLKGELAIDCGTGGNPRTVVVRSVTVDDGPRGDSRGNFDRVAQCGESIELYVEIKNESTSTIRGLVAELIETDPNIRMLYNLSSRYPDLAAGEAAENLDDWDIKIANPTPRRHDVDASITLTDRAGREWVLPLPLESRC